MQMSLSPSMVGENVLNFHVMDHDMEINSCIHKINIEGSNNNNNNNCYFRCYFTRDHIAHSIF